MLALRVFDLWGPGHKRSLSPRPSTEQIGPVFRSHPRNHRICSHLGSHDYRSARIQNPTRSPRLERTIPIMSSLRCSLGSVRVPAPLSVAARVRPANPGAVRSAAKPFAHQCGPQCTCSSLRHNASASFPAARRVGNLLTARAVPAGAAAPAPAPGKERARFVAMMARTRGQGLYKI